ncbi:MAG: hypothetical protein KF893_22975 [Caldilineaceae bacterium]|nr:hypothetical protein [Caldilineaceae bacterium]
MKMIPTKGLHACLHLALLVAILFSLKPPVAGAAPRQVSLAVEDADSLPLSPTLAWNGTIYSLTLRTTGEPLSLEALFSLGPQALADAGVTGLLVRRNGVAINDKAEVTELLDLYAAAIEMYHTEPAPQDPLTFIETLRRVIRHPLFMEQRVRAQLRNEQAEIEQLLRILISPGGADPLAESFVREFQQALLQTNYSRGAFAQTLSKAHFHKIAKALVDLQIIEMVIDEPVLLEFAVVLLLARADAAQRLGWLEELASSSAVVFNATERAAIQSIHAEFEQIEQDWQSVFGNLIEDEMLPGQVSQSDVLAWLHERFGPAPLWSLWLGPLYAIEHERPVGDNFYDHFRLSQQAVELHQALLTARADLASTAVVGDPYPGEIAQHFHQMNLLVDLAAAAALRSYADGVEATAQRGWLDVLSPLVWSSAEPEEVVEQLLVLAEQRAAISARQPLVDLAVQTAQELALREDLPQWSLYTSTTNVNQMVVRDEAVWIATGGGLVRLDRESGERALYHALNGLPDNRIVQMLEDTNGNLWVVSERGISRQDADGAWQNVLPWSSAREKPLTLAPDGTLWVNMIDRVAYKQPEEDEFVVLTREEGFLLDRVDYLRIGNDGSVWFYTHREATRLSPEGEWSTHDGSEFISDTWVRSAVAAPDGSLWLTTEKDLFRLDTTGEWTRLGDQERITFPISRIEFDADGVLWLEAQSGVHSMDLTGKWTLYQREGDRSIVGILKRTDDGSLWFRGDGSMRYLTQDGRWFLYEAGKAFPQDATVLDVTSTSPILN